MGFVTASTASGQKRRKDLGLVIAIFMDGELFSMDERKNGMFCYACASVKFIVLICYESVICGGQFPEEE